MTRKNIIFWTVLFSIIALSALSGWFIGNPDSGAGVTAGLGAAIGILINVVSWTR